MLGSVRQLQSYTSQRGILIDRLLTSCNLRLCSTSAWSPVMQHAIMLIITITSHHVSQTAHLKTFNRLKQLRRLQDAQSYRRL